jgi:cyclophilin family peptidyl-prolyl cis-trans isomerase
MTIVRLMFWGLFFLATTGVAAQGQDAASPSNADDDRASAKSDADDEAGEEGDTTTADDEAPTPEGDEFDKLLAKWKELLAKLHELSLRYQTARPGKDRVPLKKQYDELVVQAEELEPKFIAGAMTAYASNSKKYHEVGDFLASLVKSYVEDDDYERAIEPAKVLIENKYTNPRIYYLAGLAAFCTNDYDSAEKYWRQASKRSAMDADGERYFHQIDTFRERWQQEKEIREKEAEADNLPRVLLKTSKGDIVVEMFENEAPNTVANFISLVEKGFYDDVKFHRVLPGFMAQGGDPEGTGGGGPGYTIRCECRQPNHRLHFRGSLSMAKQTAPDTGGSQFFLTFRQTDHLDGQHTVFGRVIEGMNVLAKIQRIDPGSPKVGVKPDTIVEAKVLRKRDHDYVPETVPDR